jgi:hypothetical protein
MLNITEAKFKCSVISIIDYIVVFMLFVISTLTGCVLFVLLLKSNGSEHKQKVSEK